jgi:hypothetical protein
MRDLHNDFSHDFAGCFFGASAQHFSVRSSTIHSTFLRPAGSNNVWAGDTVRARTRRWRIGWTLCFARFVSWRWGERTLDVVTRRQQVRWKLMTSTICVSTDSLLAFAPHLQRIRFNCQLIGQLGRADLTPLRWCAVLIDSTATVWLY